MIDKIISNRCTGCNMCGDICPRNAIKYKINEEGFEEPEVDYSKCIKCGLCTKKCPVLNEKIFKKEIPEVYSAWIKDDDIRLKSTSGGIYYAIAKKFIDNDGYIVGSVYSEDYKEAYHIIGSNDEDLNKIIGSKYFQSSAKGIYTKIKKLLEKNEKVLFCGTPCQSAALQSFLSKEYDNLYIIDFICRGINSPLAFRKHIEELENLYNSKVKLVQLKNKKTGWQSLATYAEFENGKTYHQDRNTSPWVKGFVESGGLFIRNSCYSCKFREFPRISDITIGDFWGIQGMKSEDMFKGISSVMINSSKGNKLFDMIKEDIIYERKNLDQLLAGNPALLTDPIKNQNRDKFFKELKDKKFSDAVNSCQINKSKTNIIKKVYLKMIRILKKIKKVLEIDTLKFIKYNFFSKNIVRDKGVYLIPHRGTVLDLSKDSRIYLKGNNIELCVNKLKKSKAEAHIRMNGNAKWYSNNGCQLFYNTVLEIKDNAIFETGLFSANGGSVIVCAKNIKLGEDVMLGRNIIIYDSDHHQVFNEEMKPSNYAQPVIIEDHVWLTSNVTVLKGVTIGRDSLVTAQTLIRKDYDEASLIAGGATGKVVGKCNGWSRKTIN